MVLGIGRDPTHGNCGIRPGSVEICPEVIEAKREFSNGQHGVAAEIPRHRTRVVVPSPADCIAVAHAPGDCRHQPDRNLRTIEHRSLLDMYLKIGVDRLSLEPGLATGDALRLKTELLHVTDERLSRIRAADRQNVRSEETESGAAADIGCGEPGAFFGPKRGAGDRPVRYSTMIEEASDDGHGSHHACGAIEISSVDH